MVVNGVIGAHRSLIFQSFYYSSQLLGLHIRCLYHGELQGFCGLSLDDLQRRGGSSNTIYRVWESRCLLSR